MYSLLIVDDEKPVIDSISYIIRQERPALKIAGTARSGRAAIELAQRENPDILLIDVRMPGIDGLETIRELQRRDPSIMPILTTAYERFEIARTAFELGVVDYILKPFSKAKILRAVDAAVQRLETLGEYRGQEIRERDRMQRVVSAAEALLFRALALDLGVEECISFLRSSLDFSIEECCIVVLRPRGTGTPPSPSHAEDIGEQFRFKYRCLSGRGTGGDLLFLFPRSGEEVACPRGERLAELLRDAGVDPGAFRYSYSSWRAITELHSAFREALMGLHEGRREGGAYDGSEGAAAEGEPQEERPAVQLTPLLRALRRGETQKARELCDEALSHSPAELLRLLCAAEYETGRRTEIPAALGSTRNREDLLRLSNEWLWLQSAEGRRPQAQERSLPRQLRVALEYVDSHYHRGIQLSDVAAHAGVTSSYLSHLFSRHCYMSFIDYLTEVRVERARELLAGGARSVKEVSSAVGYRDPNYFSRIFKKQTGSSPSEYHS
jgi:two-component system response regulator YesN